MEGLRIMKYLSYDAAVFMVGKNYNIIFNTEEIGLAWVEIDGVRYYDADNGNIKCYEYIHKIEIPMERLDFAKEYRIGFRRAFERKMYFSTTEDCEYTKEYKFYPIEKKEHYNFYMIADTHSEHVHSAESGRYFGEELDFLILNGDIADGSADVEQVLTTHKIAAGVLKGKKPVIFVRGNHDTRGAMACELSKYIPLQNGKTYYTFEAGNIFGICLDCGEDKPDAHESYGHMADFTPFRREQIKFLENIIKRGDYLKYDNVIVICHMRLTVEWNEAFKDIYNEWIELLNVISPDIMLCGHEHVFYVLENGEASFDDVQKRTKYPIVVGSQCRGNDRTNHADEEPDFIGTAVTMSKNDINIKFTDSRHNILEEHSLKKMKHIGILCNRCENNSI